MPNHAFTLSLALLAALVRPASPQSQAWIRQFGTPEFDEALAAAPDGAGGLFAGGRTIGSLAGTNAGLRDAWLARHDGTGHQLWILQLGTDQDDNLRAAAADGSGGVFVGGETFGSLAGPNPNPGWSDAWLARYDSAGNRLWILAIGAFWDDTLFAAAADGADGVYVAGGTNNDLGGGPNAGLADAWLARYDAAGTRLWIRQWGNGTAQVVQAAASDSGGVFVGGVTGTNSDAWLARYDSAGTQLWLRVLGTTGTDVLRAAASDGAGGVFVGGNTRGSLAAPNAGDDDSWLAHYDGLGVQSWIRQLGTSKYDGLEAAVSDGSGGAYVGGTTSGSLGAPSAGNFDLWLARYDRVGNPSWMVQLGTLNSESIKALATACPDVVDALGYTSGDLAGPNAGGPADVWLARYMEAPVPFCTAKSGLACGTPQIDSAGFPSASATSGFVLRAGPTRSCKAGLVMYNSSSLAAGVPFQGGTLCVTPAQMQRGGPTDSQGTPGGASCDGAFALDMNAFAAGLWSVPDCAGQPSGLPGIQPAAFLQVAGQDIYCQLWGRDSVSTGSFVSGGLRYTVHP